MNYAQDGSTKVNISLNPLGRFFFFFDVQESLAAGHPQTSQVAATHWALGVGWRPRTKKTGEDVKSHEKWWKLQGFTRFIPGKKRPNSWNWLKWYEMIWCKALWASNRIYSMNLPVKLLASCWQVQQVDLDCRGSSAKSQKMEALTLGILVIQMTITFLWPTFHLLDVPIYMLLYLYIDEICASHWMLGLRAFREAKRLAHFQSWFGYENEAPTEPHVFGPCGPCFFILIFWGELKLGYQLTGYLEKRDLQVGYSYMIYGTNTSVKQYDILQLDLEVFLHLLSKFLNLKSEPPVELATSRDVGSPTPGVAQFFFSTKNIQNYLSQTLVYFKPAYSCPCFELLQYGSHTNG